MTITMLIALLLQMVTVVLLRHRLGHYWLRHPVTMIVLASVVYQGLSQVLLIFQPIGALNSYRYGVQQSYTNSAMLLMSAEMLTFTIAYLITRPERTNVMSGAANIRNVIKALDWKWLTGACVPLAILTYEGRGYNNSLAAGPTIGSDLAVTFFILLVVVAAFSFLLRHGARWFIPVLTVQSLVLAAAGERIPVITDAITLVLMLSLAGSRPSARQMRTASVLTMIAILAITGIRVEQGRSLFYEDSGLSARIFALGSGLTEFGSSSSTSLTGSALVAQTAIRADGVDFAGAILQSINFGQPRLSAAYVPESLLLVVPSSIWSSKLAKGDALDPTYLEIGNFGLQKINFLPTLPGLYIGFLPAPWLLAFLAFIGWLCGWGERWLFRRCTSARLILLAAAVIAALAYEKGLPGMLVALRAGVIIAVVVKLIEILRARNNCRHSGEILDVISDFVQIKEQDLRRITS